MKRNTDLRLRNFGILAHVDAGKTTLTESIMFATGASHKSGQVDEGNTTTDYLSQEKDRGITIQSAAVRTAWTYMGQEVGLNLVDTPGHMDFTVEVERSLRVLDGAVLLASAVKGVEAQTRTVWSQMQRHEVPALVFVNKMDRPGADFAQVVTDLRRELGLPAIAIQFPLGEGAEYRGWVDLITGQAWETSADGLVAVPVPPGLIAAVEAARTEMLEQLSAMDDVLLDQYLSGAELEAATLQGVLQKAVHARELVPVLGGTAFHHVGTEALLDAIVAYLPSPLDRSVAGLQADTEGPLAAQVFKVLADKFTGRLAFVRVYSGTLHAGMKVENGRTGTTGRIGRLLRLQGGRMENLDQAGPGEIVGIAGLRDSATGDSLGLPGQVHQLPAIEAPAPVIELAIEPRQAADTEQLAMALHQRAEEDPSFHFRTDAESGQVVIAGMGDLHLEVSLDRIREETGIEVQVGQPQVAYRETLTQVIEHRYRLKKQTGGSGQFAEISFRMGPLEGTEGLVFRSEVKGGNVPAAYWPAIERGFRRAMEEGPVEGHPLVGMEVVLLDGLTHEKDSDAMAFERCAALAFREAAAMAGGVLLEPVMDVEVDSSELYMGAVIGDLNRRGGRVQDLQLRLPQQRLLARVPLANMFGYVSTLRSLTSGEGQFAMRFAEYAPVSGNKVP